MPKNENGHPQLVSAEALEALFAALKHDIRIVILNACFSRVQAEAITKVIDCAIGMNAEIGDQAAIVFAATFYLAIGFGRSVQEAFDQAVAALKINGIPEDATPEILIKAEVDATQLFLFAPPTYAQKAVGTAWHVGDRVLADWSQDEYWYPATILSSEEGRAYIRFDDGEKHRITDHDQLRRDNRRRRD